METFTMSRKEVPRAGLVKAALAGRITNAQGAAALHLTVRQFQRLKRRLRADGARGLIHRGRGRPSARRLPESVREQIGTLLQATYAGFNDCHLADKLAALEPPSLRVSRATVRRIRRALGLPAMRRRRRGSARHRRVPEAAMGALVQVDASPFAWLQARGPELTLVGAIDDATGAILGLTFRPTEDLHGYAVVFQQIFTRYGLPLALYGDGINILVRNDPHWTLEEELAGVQAPTHLGRVLQELGIGYIQAHSPQAKGRIERLWATLQDRLVSELRLAGVATLEAANAFLPAFIPAFNARFARPPQAATPVWRRPPPDLDLILSCRYYRTVARDNTVRLADRRVQLCAAPGGRSWADYRVELRELLNGDLVVLYHDALLASQPFPGPFTLAPRRQPSAHRGDAARPPVLPAPAVLRPTAARRPASRTPRLTHPWRQPFLRRSPAVSPHAGG
jgi:hypothetical protein